MDIDQKVSLNKLWAIGIKEEQIQGLDIIVLPENVSDSDSKKRYDAQNSITLSKLLKQEGVSCANSYDLGLDLPTIERRSNDIWMGQLYILNDAILPILEGVIGSILATLILTWRKRKDLREPAGNVHADITIIRPEGEIKINYTGEPEALLKIIKTLDKKNGSNHS
ncbi:MAG: hypothetical protein V4520_12020 [Bacteroidota bacterium]